jgi:uncharacterized protein (DUF433 family)
MSTTPSYPHLTKDASGVVRIGHTRYKVVHLAAEHYHHGWTAEELLRQHPDLRPEQVYAALTYFYDHYETMVAEMQASAQSHGGVTNAPPFSRDELMRRMAARQGA